MIKKSQYRIPADLSDSLKQKGHGSLVKKAFYYL